MQSNLTPELTPLCEALTHCECHSKSGKPKGVTLGNVKQHLLAGNSAVSRQETFFLFTEEDTKETTLIHGKQVRLASISGQPLLLSKGRYNLRKLHELPVQLIRSQMLDELKSEVLCNFEWLNTKIEVRTLR